MDLDCTVFLYTVMSCLTTGMMREEERGVHSQQPAMMVTVGVPVGRGGGRGGGRGVCV